MPWVCSVCSTNNEDGNELCFVCDAPRPVAPPPSSTPASSGGVRTLTRNRVAALRLRGDVVVPEEFNVIGESAFSGRRDITSVTLHAGVKKIGASAFSGCHSLVRVLGGEGLTSIAARAFYDCPALLRPHPTARYTADDAFAMPAPARPVPPPPPPRVTPTPSPRVTPTPPPRVTPTPPPRVTPTPSPRVTPTPPPRVTPRPSAESADLAANIGIVILFLMLCASVVFFVLSFVRFVNADPLSGCLWLGASLSFALFIANGGVLGTTSEKTLIPHAFLLPISAVSLLLLGVIGEGYALVGALFAGAYMLLSLILFFYSICDFFRYDGMYVKDRVTHGLVAALSVFLFVLPLLLL